MGADKGAPAGAADDHREDPINSPPTISFALDAQTLPLETKKSTDHEEPSSAHAVLIKSASMDKREAQASVLQPAAPMGTSSLIGAIKTVRPKKQNIEKALKKAGAKVQSDQKATDKIEKANTMPTEVENSPAYEEVPINRIRSSRSDPQQGSALMSPASSTTFLLRSPPSTNNQMGTFKSSSEVGSPMDKRTTNSDPKTTPSNSASNATPGSQPRSLRQSSRRTATSSARLEKARKLFQDAEENAASTIASKNQVPDDNPVKDFALDYDSGAEPMKESRSQLLAKQRKGQVLGNSQLERQAHSSLPFIPSLIPTANIGPTRQNSIDSQAPTPTQATWNHGLSPGSPPFYPSSAIQQHRLGDAMFPETQSLNRGISARSSFDGLPLSYGNALNPENNETRYLTENSSIPDKDPHSSIGHGSMKRQSLGILPGSHQKSRLDATGKVRSWTLSQLGKGKPSILPSDRHVKREPSILELVHASMESSDGTVLNRPVRRTNTSPGDLHYVDPQRRLRSNTLTSIPATGESDDDTQKKNHLKEARHDRSHTSADPRSIQQQRQGRSHTFAFQPESVTTSSDVEDHFADSEGESVGPTLSHHSMDFGIHNPQGPISTGSESDTEHGEVVSPDLDGTGKSRMLTGISPAMRKDFHGRILQFGPNEDEYQPLKTRMHSAASSINSIAGTHGSAMSPAPPPAPTKTAIALATDTKICDTCGKPTATSVLTLMEPCCHLACFDCLNAVLNTVCSNGPGGNPGRSRCSAFECGKEIVGIVPYLLAAEPVREQVNKMEDRDTQLRLAVDALPYENEETVVVRMDNVAWDVTPEAVVAFLPPNTLADDLIQNVHIMLDRNDGKAKDYLFFECRDRQTATQVLRTKQNAVLGSPPRARPVTLTLSTHAALITELRPSSPQELENLMLLCRSIDNQAGSVVVDNPTGLQTPQQTPRRSASDSLTSASPAQSGRFLKSSLAPFHSVLSLLSKIATKDQTGSVNSKASIIYWDLFACAAGAIAVLAKRIIAARRSQLPPTPPLSQLDLISQTSPTQSDKMVPGSPKAPFSRARSDSQTAQVLIDAKIREKLEKDRARQTSGQSGPLATPRAQGRSRTEQPATPFTPFKPVESVHSREQEEALAHLMIAAFEKTFGVRIDQRESTGDVQA